MDWTIVAWVTSGEAVISMIGPLDAGHGVDVAWTTALPLACGKGLADALGDALARTAALGEGEGDDELPPVD